MYPTRVLQNELLMATRYMYIYVHVHVHCDLLDCTWNSPQEHGTKLAVCIDKEYAYMRCGCSR